MPLRPNEIALKLRNEESLTLHPLNQSVDRVVRTVARDAEADACGFVSAFVVDAGIKAELILVLDLGRLFQYI
jgi:hypothetical protein